MTPEQQRAIVLARVRARLRQNQEAEQAAQLPPPPAPTQWQRGMFGAGGEGSESVAPPSRAEAGELARYSMQRRQMDRMVPGFGVIAGPISRSITDPDRRAAAGRSFQGFLRDVQALPSLDYGRLARDTGAAINEGVRNLPQTAAAIAQNLPAIVRGATYGPIEDEEFAQQRLDLSRLRGDPEAIMREAEGANAQALQSGINVAAPVVLGSAPSLLRTTGVTAAATAPAAFSGSEPLQERVPQGIAQTGGASLLAGALQQGASALTRNANRATRVNQRAADFQSAGVRPTMAAVHGRGAAPMTMAIAENPIGGNVRANLENSVNDVAARAREIAARYGQHGQPENVGEALQAGVRRFASEAPPPPRNSRPETISTRDWSFKAKANALYDDVFDLISRDEAGHLSGRTGVQATADNARQALASMQSEVSAPNVAELVADPTLQRVAAALEQDAGALRFNDLRRLRTWVREARERPSLTQNIDQASLARLESALTQDIYESAMAIGGEYAAQRLRRVDQFYRAGQNRIQNALQPFTLRSGRGAFDRVISLAREGGQQNTRQLQSLRNSLKPDEWREVSATVIDELGRPNPGNARALEAGEFSIENFATNYAKLSPNGRRILFGGAATDDLMQALDTLARVAGYTKQVRGFANMSRSGSSVQNMSTLTAGLGATGAAVLGNAAPLAMLAALGLGARVTGEMLTNPHFVRWLTSGGKGSGGVRQQVAALNRLAARDPALAQLASELSQRQPQEGAAQEQRQRQTAGSRR